MWVWASYEFRTVRHHELGIVRGGGGVEGRLLWLDFGVHWNTVGHYMNNKQSSDVKYDHKFITHEDMQDVH